MKNILIKIGAVASIGAGALLLVLPVVASERKSCRSDGGYHEIKTGTGCSFVRTKLSDGRIEYDVRGTCGGYRFPKGYYCAKDKSGFIEACVDSSIDATLMEPATAEAYEGTCVFWWGSKIDGGVKEDEFSEGLTVPPDIDNGSPPYPLHCQAGFAPWHPTERVMIGTCVLRT